MTETATTPTPPYLESLEPVIVDVVAPAAVEIDQTGAFPRAALDALGAAGLLGLISSTEVGGQGLRLGDRFTVPVEDRCRRVERLLH